MSTYVCPAPFSRDSNQFRIGGTILVVSVCDKVCVCLYIIRSFGSMNVTELKTLTALYFVSSKFSTSSSSFNQIRLHNQTNERILRKGCSRASNNSGNKKKTQIFDIRNKELTHSRGDDGGVMTMATITPSLHITFHSYYTENAK